MIDLIASHPFLSTVTFFVASAVGFFAWVGRDQEDATRAAYEAERHVYPGDEGDQRPFSADYYDDKYWRDIAS